MTVKELIEKLKEEDQKAEVKALDAADRCIKIDYVNKGENTVFLCEFNI